MLPEKKLCSCGWELSGALMLCLFIFFRGGVKTGSRISRTLIERKKGEKRRSRRSDFNVRFFSSRRSIFIGNWKIIK